MKLGQLIADVCVFSQESGQNLMECEVLVHTVGQGEKMLPASIYLLEQDGKKVLHFDAEEEKTGENTA